MATWLSLLALFASFDLETHLIEEGLLAPRIVCGSYATKKGGILLDRKQAHQYARLLLDHEASNVIVGANIAFDFGCLAAEDPDLLPLIFKAYGEGRVYDVQIAQALHAIAEGNLYQDPITGDDLRGRYSLDRCVRFVLGREDAKKRDFWRKRYAMLENTPLDEWPEEARQYPVDDVVNTLEVAIAQVQGGGAGITPGPHRNLGDLSNQAETAFAMHLGAIWGLRTDPDRVEALRRRTMEAHESFVEKFKKLGFYKVDPKTGEAKKDQIAVKRAVIRAYNGSGAVAGVDLGNFYDTPCPDGCKSGKVISEKSGNAINCKTCAGTGLDIGAAPRTPADGVKADRDALVETGDLDLAALGDNEPEKTLSTYLPFLIKGVDKPITLSPNVLVASGRTSYDGLIQLFPKYGGERACIRARDGYVLCSVDFSALELCTWGQVKLWIFDRSVMADTINASGDPGMLHTALAASIRGWTTEEMVAALKSIDKKLKAEAKRYRDAAKPANFGFPGGMGAVKLVLTNRKKNAGETFAPDGLRYPGIRFCILLDGADRCGTEKVTEWKGMPCPPVCKHCVTIAEEVLRPAWFSRWTEAKWYLRWVSERVGDDGRGELPCFATERVRGGLNFTNGANNGFQALAADGAKNALRKLVRECYLDRESPLWGSRPVFFVHDEIIAELPEETAHLAAPRMAEIMIAAMREYVPDVTIKAEPALMRHWLKAAEPHYVDIAGERRLVPWDDYNAAPAGA